MIIQPKALVVLTHGFLGARVQFLPIATILSRKYDVLNFGYKSREYDLASHADALIDSVRTRLQRNKQVTHFVTHSFGGVVLHRAFVQGLGDVLGTNLEKTKCVLIAPPLRGASFARAFQKENIAGPDMFKQAIHKTAQTILGDYAGAQLMMNDESWFENEIGMIPKNVKVLVVAGRTGRINPLISGDSDGVVATEETMLNREHHRVEVKMTHNLLLYSSSVTQCISNFLSGQSVGVEVSGIRETKIAS